MTINVKNLPDILDNKVSLVGRGILITILLLKEKDPKLTLAKCKTKINFTTNKKELIQLHKSGFITWSGYDAAVKSLNKDIKPEVLEILGFMNNLYRRNFGPTEERVRLIDALLLKYSVEEVTKVVANRYVMWKEDTTMQIHLIPETVFRMSKFQKYLDEVNYTKKGESFVTASKINLKQGDEITLEIVNLFSDLDTYTVMSYDINSEGKKTTNGVKVTKYGKDFKRLLKIRDRQEEKGFILTYIQQ